jgi:hypothetical protein
VEILWVVWMLPDVIGLGGIECIFPIEEPAHASGCLFGFVRTVRNELLRKSHKTALSVMITYRVHCERTRCCWPCCAVDARVGRTVVSCWQLASILQKTGQESNTVVAFLSGVLIFPVCMTGVSGADGGVQEQPKLTCEQLSVLVIS